MLFEPIAVACGSHDVLVGVVVGILHPVQAGTRSADIALGRFDGESGGCGCPDKSSCGVNRGRALHAA